MAGLGKLKSSAHAHAHTIGGSCKLSMGCTHPNSEIAPPGIVIKLIKRLTCLGPGCGLMWRMSALANAAAAGLHP